MKYRAWVTSFIVLLLLAQAITPAQTAPLASYFPELTGWRQAQSPAFFYPETLYEHINGAAENFLSFDFQELAVLTYVNENKQTLNAEIYFHGTPENAFGIYSSEKPLAGSYLSIGSQGYIEDGVLNFFSDAYYIKLNSFDLGLEGKAIMSTLAEQIARAIGGRNALPSVLSAFPQNGKVEHSERYIRTNFMGHEFLHSAFMADYLVDGQRFQLFAIDAGSQPQALAMLEHYAALEKAGPGPENQAAKWKGNGLRPGALTINDPYAGMIQLFWQGKYICGSSNPKAADHIAALARNLSAQP